MRLQRAIRCKSLAPNLGAPFVIRVRRALPNTWSPSVHKNHSIRVSLLAMAEGRTRAILEYTVPVGVSRLSEGVRRDDPALQTAVRDSTRAIRRRVPTALSAPSQAIRASCLTTPCLTRLSARVSLTVYAKIVQTNVVE